MTSMNDATYIKPAAPEHYQARRSLVRVEGKSGSYQRTRKLRVTSFKLFYSCSDSRITKGSSATHGEESMQVHFNL